MKKIPHKFYKHMFHTYCTDPVTKPEIAFKMTLNGKQYGVYAEIDFDNYFDQLRDFVKEKHKIIKENI